MHNPLLNHAYDYREEFSSTNKLVSPFLASGDLQPFDVERISDLKVSLPLLLVSLCLACHVIAFLE